MEIGQTQMSDEVTPSDASFDLEKLRELFEMMEQHGLTEVNLQHGEEKWRLRRGNPVPQMMAPQMAAPQYAPAAPTAASPPADTGSAAEELTGTFIESPTVGTFYSAPSPDDPPFVNVGSTVTPSTVVCTVEAMKVFNQIEAKVSGTIAEVLVSNGDAVEFGQKLFRLNP